MIKRLCDLWKWLAALLLLAAVAIALLIAEPPDVPVLVVVSDFLSELWTRPFLANRSYGATLLLVIQATVLVVLLWFAARLASRIVRAQFLDRRQLDEGRKFASELYFEVFAAFKREGIEIPFPQRDLHLRSVTESLPGGRLVTGATETDSPVGGPSEPRVGPSRGGE